jgi:hypothetical protein
MMGTRPIYAGNGSTAVMPGWNEKYGGPLRADEIAEISRFILNWEATALGRVTLEQIELPRMNLADRKNSAEGEHVFVEKCSRCHVFRDIDRAQIPGPELSGFSTIAPQRREGYEGIDYLKESVMIPNAYLVDGYTELADEHSCGAVLSFSDLESVGSFLLQ